MLDKLAELVPQSLPLVLWVGCVVITLGILAGLARIIIWDK